MQKPFLMANDTGLVNVPFEQSWLGLAPPSVKNEQSYVGLPPCGGRCCPEMHSSLGPCTPVPSREYW